MIVVFVEEWPNGDQSQATALGSLAIHDATQPGDLLRSYRYEIDEAPAPNLGVEQLKKLGHVQAHNHRQSIWKLIGRVIETTFPKLVV